MARGQCYPWAAAYALKHLDDNVVVVHAIVTAPCSTPPHRYTHAWVEHNGMAYDWQTIEAGQGGPNFQGKGYPIDLFYELFTPERVHKYTPAEVLKLRGEHGHVGPWTEDHDDVIRQQMQREKGAAYARGSSSRAWAGPDRKDRPMTSHTPGPWRNGEDGHNILSAQPGERPKMLASVYHDLGGVGGLTSKEHAEAHANARLMAAAPDLLAACRAQHRNIATLLQLIDESDQWADLASMSALGDIANAMRADEAAVNAAIAKAEKGTDR